LRLGRDKAFEPFGKGILVERVLSRLSLFKSDIILVKNHKQDFTHLDSQNIKVVEDIYPEKGPLGGIYTGLSFSQTQKNVVVACDMPFLNTGLLVYLVQQSEEHDIVVPCENDHFEPLHAVYSKRCVGPIKELLDKGEKQLIRLFKMVDVRYVRPGEIERFDPHHISFFNINNEEDLKRARLLDNLESELTGFIED